MSLLTSSNHNNKGLQAIQEKSGNMIVEGPNTEEYLSKIAKTTLGENHLANDFFINASKLESIGKDQYRVTTTKFGRATSIDIQVHKEKITISGQGLGEKMEYLVGGVLKSRCKGFFPYNQMEKVELLREKRLNLHFKGSLEGTASEVDKGGWKDMKYSRLVMNQHLMLTISGTEVAFGGKGLQMGIHAEDYGYVSSLARKPTAVKIALKTAGYISLFSGSPKYGLEFAATVKKLSKVRSLDGRLYLNLAVDVHGKNEEGITPKKCKTPLPGSRASGLLLSGIKSEVDEITLGYDQFNNTFKRFEWKVKS